MNDNQFTESDPLSDNFDNTLNTDKTNKLEQETPVSPPKPETKFYSCYKDADLAIQYKNRVLALPTVLTTDEDLNECLKMCIDFANQNSKDAEAIESVEKAVDAFKELTFLTYGNKYHKFFTENVGRLTQQLEGQRGLKVQITYPRVGGNSTDAVVNGRQAIYMVRRKTKTGSTTRCPLVHSALSLVIEPVTSNEFIDLSTAIQSRQINIGKHTRGAVFTGDDIHVVGPIIEFVLSKVIETNIKKQETSIDRLDLDKLIDVTDIPLLLAGSLAAIYPNGYPVYHACKNTEKETVIDPENIEESITKTKKINSCNYIITAQKDENGHFKPDSLLDFSKTVWMDNNILDAKEAFFLTDSSYSKTIDDIREYKNNLKLKLINKYGNNYNKFTVYQNAERESDNIKVVFKVPNIREYKTSSLNWIQSVKDMAEQALTGEEDLTTQEDIINKRAEFINRYAKSINLGKHLCWVDYIEFNDGETRQITTGSTEIKEILNELILADGIEKEFEKALQDFKELSIVAATGVNNFECPVCHSGQTDPASKTPSLIPINMVGYFLSITVWK